MSVCPCCGKEMVPCCSVPGCKAHVEVYSRPCGYLRPVSNWNFGKVEEFKDRSEYQTWGTEKIDGIYGLGKQNTTMWFGKQQEFEDRATYVTNITDKAKQD